MHWPLDYSLCGGESGALHALMPCADLFPSEAEHEVLTQVNGVQTKASYIPHFVLYLPPHTPGIWFRSILNYRKVLL